MVIVRASFDQHWRGDHYKKDAKMPATKEQAVRLTQSGQAYYDFEDEVPTMSSTKDKIRLYLDNVGIPYNESETKAELLEHIDGRRD